jgi:hypothetical protein
LAFGTILWLSGSYHPRLLEPFPWLVLGVHQMEQAHPHWKDELQSV